MTTSNPSCITARIIKSHAQPCATAAKKGRSGSAQETTISGWNTAAMNELQTSAAQGGNLENSEKPRSFENKNITNTPDMSTHREKNRNALPALSSSMNDKLQTRRAVA